MGETLCKTAAVALVWGHTRTLSSSKPVCILYATSLLTVACSSTRVIVSVFKQAHLIFTLYATRVIISTLYATRVIVSVEKSKSSRMAPPTPSLVRLHPHVCIVTPGFSLLATFNRF